MDNLPNVYTVDLDKKLHQLRDGILEVDDLIYYIHEYGRQVRDKTLEWAAENAELAWDGNPYNYEQGSDSVDRDSILKGKIHKDLEI